MSAQFFICAFDNLRVFEIFNALAWYRKGAKWLTSVFESRSEVRLGSWKALLFKLRLVFTGSYWHYAKVFKFVFCLFVPYGRYGDCRRFDADEKWWDLWCGGDIIW